MIRLMVILGLCFHLWDVNEPKVTMWEILKESELGIGGTTNVSDFYCGSDTYVGNDKLYETIMPDGGVSWNGTINIRAYSFDCANKIMTSDFQSIILAEQYPFITMQFIDLYKKDELGTILAGEAVVTLAEGSKKINITCRMERMKDGVMKLTGSHTFLFSDFGLEPPKKFFGTIKVNNEVTVDFKILLKPQTSASKTAGLL